MKYALDTNTIILLLRENEQVNKKFDHFEDIDKLIHIDWTL